MKHNRHGQSEPMMPDVYKKLRANFCEESHQNLLDIAYYTGERWGAILQLRVDDLYKDPTRRQLHDKITFRAETRKDRSTRQVPIHPELKMRLRAYQPPSRGWLFPSSILHEGHLTMRAADGAFRRALVRAGLQDAGFSTHSTRRGFITQLHNKGIALKVIQALTGHKSLNTLSKYIEVSEEQLFAAVAAL
jgi:integrase/recombinase XerD